MSDTVKKALAAITAAAALLGVGAAVVHHVKAQKSTPEYSF